MSLIIGHGLWERAPSPESRPQVVLFNLATALTVACGVAALYIAQLIVLLRAALILVTPTMLGGALHHHAHLGGYLNLAPPPSGEESGRPSLTRVRAEGLNQPRRADGARPGLGVSSIDLVV